MSKKTSNFLVQFIESTIFASRWILAPLYLGLVLGVSAYSLKFIVELWHLISEVGHITEELMMLGLLTLVDITMVGNLVLMTMIGGYSIFVREIEFDNLKDKPRWLNHINSGTLKIKMGMSLMGVSSIHLLKSFINAEHIEWEVLCKQMSVHGLFIVSTIALAIIDRALHPPQVGGSVDALHQDSIPDHNSSGDHGLRQPPTQTKAYEESTH